MHDKDNVAAMFIEIKNDVKHIYTRMDKHCEYIEALQVDQEQTKTRVTKLEVNHEILEKENNELTAANKALHKEVNELTTHKKSGNGTGAYIAMDRRHARCHFSWSSHRAYTGTVQMKHIIFLGILCGIIFGAALMFGIVLLAQRPALFH